MKLKKSVIIISFSILLLVTGCLGLLPEDNNSEVEISDDNDVSGEINEEEEDESTDEGNDIGDDVDRSIDSQYYNEQPTFAEILSTHSDYLEPIDTFSYEYSIESDEQSFRSEIKINENDEIAEVFRDSEQETTTNYYVFDLNSLYTFENDQLLTSEFSDEELEKLKDTSLLISTFLQQTEPDQFLMDLEGSVDDTELFRYEAQGSSIEVEIENNIIQSIEIESGGTVIEKNIITTGDINLEVPEDIEDIIEQER